MRAFLSSFLVIATLSVPSTVRAEDAAAQSVQQASLMLVRYTLTALDQANRSGNYAVLRDLGGATFRKSYSAEQLATVFAAHRKAKLSLAAATVLEPVWTMPATRDNDGTLRLAGYYPAGSMQTHFDLRFVQSEAGWKVAGVSVTLQPIQEVSVRPAPSICSAITSTSAR